MMQLLGNKPHKFLRQSRDALAEVVEESLNLFVTHGGVHRIVRLELLEQRILFVLDRLVSLVDREVEGGNDRTIHPRFAYIVAELSALIAWQEPYNDGNGEEDEDDLGDEVAPEVLLRIVKYAHIVSLCLVVNTLVI